MREFKLSPSFLDSYRDKQPDWGPLGYVTYKRTYSRTKEDGTSEEFWETIARVVEGVYSAQKAHCRSLRLPWNNEKAQRSAQEMYRRMWDFKFLPPGRGLWMMGTDVVDKTSAGLFNCAFVSTKDIKLDFAEPFSWAMDMLMLGVGVGFDTQGAGLIRIQKPKQGTDVFVVEDSREGWVELLRRVMASYVGKGSMPQDVDYSLVRPAGTPISGFGGTASGPDPLKELIQGVRSILDALVGQEITSEAIADIFSFIGRCVVAGNIRRSSLLALGDPNDEDFLSLKDPVINQDKMMQYRWAVNNSINAVVGQDYTEAAKLTAKNGEPGYEWLGNAQKFSRMKDPADYKDMEALGTNPCQPAYATVLTPEGIRTFADIDVGSTIWSGTAWTKVTAKWSTGTKPVHRYETAAGVFVGTENHRILQHGTKVEVKDADGIDQCVGPQAVSSDLQPRDIINGLVLGDVGGDNYDYSDSEISHLIGDRSKAGDFYHFVTSDFTHLPLTYNREIPDTYMYGDSVAVRGFLRGLYTANGSVIRSGKHGRVTLKSSSKTLVTQVQVLLSSLGIRSYITTNKPAVVEFPNGFYECKESYDLNITTDRTLFRDLIGFVQKYKNERLDSICPDTPSSKKCKTTYEIKSAEYVGDEEVFDITVDDPAHTYWTGGLLVSNCAEITLFSYETCNLVETFPSRHDTYEDYQRTLKYAYLYAKSVTLLTSHQERTNAVTMRNRRIGCSMSGIVQAMQKHGKREFFKWCDAGYDYIEGLDAVYSNWLCIPKSIKTTTVKPSGSISLLPGVTPGIHYPHSQYYIRRIRVKDDHPIVKVLEVCGYPVEKDAYSPNTVVAEFPVKEEHFDRSKSEVSMWEQLENAAQMQAYWADNQVSVTVTFKPEEASQIKHALELYETRLKGVSFLPLEDHGYVQAPYETITEDEYNRRIAEVDAESLPILLRNMSTHTTDDKYCDGDKCII